MKKFINIFFFIGVTIHAATAANDDTLSVLHAWQLRDNFTDLVPAPIDTNLPNFQVYYPNYEYSESNTFLSNLGTSTVSNIFTDRIHNDDRFYLNPFLPYFFTPENTKYYNTRRPFSSLSYTNGTPKRIREETFEAFITENINPKLNFALRYHVISSRGQYIYQQVKKNSFHASANYLGDRYTMHSSLNVNRHIGNESGGIIDSVFESGSYDYTVGIPTRIAGGNSEPFESNAQNQIRHFDYMLTQRLKLFTLGSKSDTLQEKKAGIIAEPELTYVIRASRATKKYTDSDPLGSGLYDQVYFNTNETLDSVAGFRLTNLARLDFKSTFGGKVQTGIFGTIANEYEHYHHFSLWDSTYVPGNDTLLTPYMLSDEDTLKGVNLSKDHSSTYFSVGLYGNFWNRVRTDFEGKVYFLGYKSGETEFKGDLNTDISILKRNFFFDVSASFRNKMPGYLLENYYANNYIWTEDERDLNTEIWTSLSGRISAPSNKFELGADYNVISNLIYFNAKGKPVNSANPVNVISIDVAKTFKLWKLYSVNKITYQVSENPEILAIPNLVVYNSTYLNHTFRFKSTGGELQTILGVDIYYLTQYHGYRYSPALSQFYMQNEMLIGNYPLMDVFLNLKLKRTRFFLKLQHFASGWLEQNYYSAIHYPHNQLMSGNEPVIKFGLSWVFYD